MNWCCTKLDNLGKMALITILGNASWHISKEVHTWIQTHNHTVKHQGKEVRIIAFYLPSKSVTAPIIGPRTIEQLESAVRATEITLDAEVLAKLDEIFPGPGGEAPKAYAW